MRVFLLVSFALFFLFGCKNAEDILSVSTPNIMDKESGEVEIGDLKLSYSANTVNSASEISYYMSHDCQAITNDIYLFRNCPFRIQSTKQFNQPVKLTHTFHSTEVAYKSDLIRRDVILDSVILYQVIDDKLEFHSYCDYKLENDNIVFSSYITDQGTYAIGTYLDNRGFILNELNTTVTIIENNDSLKYTFFEDEETSYNSTSLLEKVYLEGSKERIFLYIENDRHLLFTSIFIPNLSRKGVTNVKGNRVHIQTTGEFGERLYGNDITGFPIKYDLKYEKSGINVSNVFFEGTIETKAVSTLSNDTVDFIINFNHTILE